MAPTRRSAAFSRRSRRSRGPARDCTKFGPIAPQPLGTRKNAFRLADLPQSEDCLNLNLWTPALDDGRKRPVFVFIHGGGVDSQSANLIDGAALARLGDAVVIGVNHRLGGFGFLFLGDVAGAEYAASGNAGMLDLVLALQWVRANAGAFGGDPGRVTIFGESGGAAKCALLMAMPAAHGLFHRAWTISGSAITAGTRRQANAVTESVLARLGLPHAHIAEIRTLPLARLVAAFAKLPLGPIVDGEALPRDPFYPDASPLSAGIPMVIGSTHDEMTSFLVKDPAYSNLTWGNLADLLRARNPLGFEPRPEKTVAEYRRLHPAYSPTEVAYAVATDSALWKGVVAMSERRAEQGAPTWVYCVDWPGRGKAVHSIELALLVHNPEQGWRTNPDREPTAPKMADIMSAAFLAFGRTGDPNCGAVPGWPGFDTDGRPTMIFDLPPRVQNDPRGAERQLFATRKGAAPAPSADDRAPEPEYAPLQPLAGVWSTTVTTDADGTPVRQELRIEWADRGAGQSVEASLVRGVERLPLACGVYTWNAAARNYTYTQKNRDGTAVQGVAIVVDGTLELLFSITKPGGATDSGYRTITTVRDGVLTKIRFRKGRRGDWEKTGEEQYERIAAP